MTFNEYRRSVVCYVAMASAFLSILQSADRAQAQTSISSSLERSTFAVVRVDLENLNLPKTLEVLQENTSGLLPAKAVAGFQSFALPVIDSLKEAGAQEVYATLSTIDTTSGKAAVIVPADESNRNEIAEQLKNLFEFLPPAFGYTVHKMPNAVVACCDATWERLKGQREPPADRDFLLHAIDVAGELPLSLTIAIRPDLRASVSTLWPEKLPKALAVELSPRVLMRDIRFLQLGVRNEPNLAVSLVLQCVDQDSTTQIANQLKSVWPRIGLNMSHNVKDSGQLVYELQLPQISQLAHRLQQESVFMQQSNNLKQVSLALHNFEAKHSFLPPRMTVSVAKRPLLSWRVHLLPFMEQQALYDEFHLDEPWSSPHNKQLIQRMPRSYESLVGPKLELGLTCIQAPMMVGSYWHGTESKLLTLNDIPDGTSNTLCFVIAPRERAVIWTKPDDLQVDARDPAASLLGDRDRIQVALFDGSVQTISTATDRDTWKAWLTHHGGEEIRRP